MRLCYFMADEQKKVKVFKNYFQTLICTTFHSQIITCIFKHRNRDIRFVLGEEREEKGSGQRKKGEGEKKREFIKKKIKKKRRPTIYLTPPIKDRPWAEASQTQKK